MDTKKWNSSRNMGTGRSGAYSAAVKGFSDQLSQRITERTFRSMNKLTLLCADELPQGFRYPKQFDHIVQLGLTELQPWYVLNDEQMRRTMAGLAKRYSNRTLVPFARRQDNDDIACWEAASNESVYIIHDFAPPGCEEVGRYPSFYDWFRRAIDDLIGFDW